MAVNFITICGSVITIYGSVVTICGNLVTIYGKLEKVKGTKETMNGMVEKVNVNIVLKHGNPTTILNYLIILLDKYTKLTDKKRPTPRLPFTSTFCRGETPTTPAKRACTKCVKFININHSSTKDTTPEKQNTRHGSH